MNLPRACAIAATIIVTASSAVAMASQAGPEHARLTAMAGMWDVEMSFWFEPGAPPVVTKGTSTIRPVLNGQFIEERIDGTHYLDLVPKGRDERGRGPYWVRRHDEY
jgi:uncharacterized protein DUF1579